MLKRLCVIVIIIVIFIHSASAAPKPKRLMLREIQGLNFGYLAPGQTEVSVDPLNPPIGTYPAQLKLTGEPWMYFQIVPPDVGQLTRGSSSIPVNGFVTDLPNNQGQLDGLGEFSFKMGATVGPVPLGVSGGGYSGRVTVTVYYLY